MKEIGQVMNSEKKSTFRQKISNGARSVLLTNTLLALLRGFNVIPRFVPSSGTLNPDQVTTHQLQKNEWERNQRDRVIRIQAGIEAVQQELATAELDSSQLHDIDSDLITAVDRVESILREFKSQPPPRDPAKLTEFQANRQRIEKLEKLLAEIKIKSDKEKLRLVQGGSATKNTLYDRAESILELLREMLELKNFFLFAGIRKGFVNTRDCEHPDLGHNRDVRGRSNML